MSVFDSLNIAEQARQLRNPQGEVGLAVAAWLNERNRRAYAAFIAALALEPESCVLEIGFGNGRSVPDVLAQASRGRYAGVDISPTMVEEAKRFNADFIASGRAEFHCASAERMPFPDALFDRAFSIGVVHFWRDAVAPLRELRRVLRPDGVAIMAALTPPAVPDFARAEFGFFLRDAAVWEAHGREAGFREVRPEMLEFDQAGADGVAIKRTAVRVSVRA